MPEEVAEEVDVNLIVEDPDVEVVKDSDVEVMKDQEVEVLEDLDVKAAAKDVDEELVRGGK